MQDNIAVLREWIAGSDNIVFFGGAGVSTESGIPDFRSTDGLYRQEYKYPPETILSHTFFEQNPEEFFILTGFFIVISFQKLSTNTLFAIKF